LITPVFGYIANKFEITYKPGSGKNGKEFDNPAKAIHKVETPALGGLSVTIPILIAIIVFFRLDPTTIPILLALAILVIGSILDDIFTLSAKVQLGIKY
jgi:UDP-N-acetylmuramyl pentapeptide phosphotransferase/UDP-N-acetylglucosamine-1-phosphate transferase